VAEKRPRVKIDPAAQPSVDAALDWLAACVRRIAPLGVGEDTGLDEATYDLLIACLERWDDLEALEAIEADPKDLAEMEAQVIWSALIAHGMHKRGTQPSTLADPGMTEAEFSAKWLVPMDRQAIVIARRSERRYLARLRAPRVLRPQAVHRPRARRRHADRRAAGLRSGTDPGDGDPEPASALSAAVTAPAHALNDGNSPYTRADRARGSRPVFVLYERHPVYGLVNRPLGRFLGGRW
jgi:hypothetical protein